MNGNNHSSFETHDYSSKLDVILERMDFQDQQIAEIKMNVNKISDLVVNPENGMYGRVKSLEVSKRNNSKVFWIVFTAIISLACSSVLWSKIFIR